MPSAELASTTRALAERFAAGPPAALALAKRLVNRAATSDLGAALEREAFAQGLSAESDDHQERLRAFFEKRAPRFGGS